MPAPWRTLFAWVALLIPALSLAAPPGPASLTVSARPAMLRLAEGGRAVVRFAGSAAAPVVAVSAGRLEGLREVASGIYEAEYLPPDTLDPQVVVVSAFSDGRFGWTTIDLAGVREVEVKAPHRSLVTVSVSGDVYGPVPADGTGRAVLRVDVPPGVYFATSRGQRFDLDVPRRGYSHVALDRAALEASAVQSVALRVIALDDAGKPVRRAAVKLRASEGNVAPPAEVAPGVLQARWSVAAGPVRQARVTADVQSRPPSTSAAVLRRIAGAPREVRVDVDRERIVAGEGDELKVTGRVVDAGGNVTDEPARLVVSVGVGDSARLLPDAVIDWQQTGAGWAGRVQVPRQRSGRQQLELKVVSAGGLVGTRVVDLVAGPPATVAVEPEEELFADGRSRQLRVVLLDKHGNRTDASGNAEVTATRGTITGAERSTAGVYLVNYRSPLSATDYDDVIHARVGPLEGETELRVRARGSTVVLGLKGGYSAGTGSLSTPSGGVELGFWMPSLRTSLGVVLDIRYYAFSRDQVLSAGTVSLPVGSDATFIAIEPSLAWRRPLLGGMLWLGAGPGLVHASTKVAAAGQQDLTSSSWAPSAHASVSWGFRVGPGIPFAEVKGGWQGEASDSALKGSIETVTVNLGYRFDVF